MASDFGKPRPGSGSQSSRDWLKQSPDPIGKNRWGGFKVQKKGNGGRKFCSGVPSMSKNTATILKTSNRAHDKSHLFPQVRHREKTTNDEKNLQI